MSNAIPKEHMTAFQRWEMTSFDDDAPGEMSRHTTAEEILEKIHETARVSGYAEGYSAGLADSRAATEIQKQAIDQLLYSFSSEMANTSHTLAQNVLDLTLDLTKAMLRQALAVNLERVLPVIREALASLPGTTLPAQLFLNPADADLVNRIMQAELADANWHVRCDASLDRGGCRIETDICEVDASNAQRWKKIAQALGNASDWLE